ncbi:cell wall-binding repeat-containing protein [Romboutsia sedimentorum]|uniref:Cell wall-binding repeat-containing protein n=1 Tax=Romboutsia sedimentorum TaxID=1368474 RepID=A0ABT7EAF0_9FIRM|nr:cell wall-binding repeat-containing protein [Romboutsia sedimentorum]MDK2562941.1 cell wall-binding repeat-containing protein [Romboutsia sedimentorum]
MSKYKYTSILTIVGIVATTPSSYATAEHYAVIDSEEQQRILELKKQTYQLFNTKYTTNKVYMNDPNKRGCSAYKIQIADNLEALDKEEYLTSYAQFDELFNEKYSNLKYNQKIVVKYSTISRKLKNEELVDYKELKYNGNEKNVIWKTLADGNKQGKIPISPDTTTEQARFIYVNVGDILLDINKPAFRQKNGYYIDINENPIKKVDKNIIETKVSLQNGIIDGYYQDSSVALGQEDIIQNTDAIVKDADEISTQELKVDDIYEVNSGRLTIRGNELLKNINEMNKSQYTIRFEAIDKITDEPREIYIDKSDSSNIAVRYVDNNIEVNYKDLSSINIIIEETTMDNKYRINKLIIKPVKKVELDNIIELMKEKIEINIYAGLDRYKTSVQVSRNTYKNTTDNVVLVSGEDNSLVDGLTSTPLASSLDAPILITKKDEIPNEVLEEIDRLNAKNIYIIGGENAVSKQVYDKLKTHYGKNMKRISGKDRYETSLAVANEIVGKVNHKVDTFIVAGNGEADALSISSVAGKKQVPIILTKKEGLSYDNKYFLMENADKAYILGGRNIISNSVDEDILDINMSVRRIYGENRKDTNAAIIKEFYSNGKELHNNGGLIISKSDNKGFVDSLSAGVLGAKMNAPVFLATDSLSEEQGDTLHDLNSKKNKIQVGYGISNLVAEFINSIK